MGELPTQTFALVRLMLAVLHRAVPWRGGELDRWQQAWDGGLDVATAVTAHLDAHADRFDLLHPVTPFCQVADLATASGETKALTTLVADVPNNAQFFTTRAGRGLERLDLAEAARWVVHAQAFDPSGIKSGAVGDARVKGGRGYPIGTGWAGGVGGLLLEGRDLYETLLLNLVLLDRRGQSWDRDDHAVWERPPQTSAVEGVDRRPTGPADLLTWQSRRIRLFHDGEHVTRVLVANGDPLGRQNLFRLEAMTGWRRSQAQEKARREPLVYMPREHEPSRALWRGLPALLSLADHDKAGEAAPSLTPGLFRWLEVLTADGLLEDDHPVRTRGVGMAYGSNQSVVDEVVDDALTMHAVLLSERGAELRADAVRAVDVADQAVRALAGLASDLARAAGGSPDDADGARDRARERAFFALDAPFRLWLGSLRPGADPDERRQAWERFVDQALRDLADEMLADAGLPAWVGREVRSARGAHHVDASLAHVWFTAALRKALVLAARPESASTSTTATEGSAA